MDMVIILEIFIWFCMLPILAIQKGMSILRKKCDAGLPPFRIQLVPSSDTAWTASSEVRRLAQELAAAGFLPAGVYDVRGFEDARYMLFLHQASGVIGNIVGKGKKTWLDVKTVMANGQSVTTSTCEDFGLPQRPGNEVLRAANPDEIGRASCRERV